MFGLFATLNLGTRSLQTQQTAVEVAGQNLANVNNPAYARQRVTIQTSPTVETGFGPQGTGADAVAIVQIRSAMLDAQMQGELSVGGYWTAQQSALQYAQAGLGEFIDRTGGTGSTADGTAQGLADELTGLFNAFQGVAASPTSLADRQLLLSRAGTLATRLNQTAERLGGLRDMLDASLQTDVGNANQLLSEISKLNNRIADAEFSTGGTANDLRDLRQQKIEELARVVNIETSENANGTVNISIGGTQLVSDRQVLDTLETYDAGGGQMLVRTVTAGTPLTLAGGSMQGTIEARDGALAALNGSLNTLAAQLITQVNTAHAAGFSLSGSTGADFFTGTDAATIAVNSALVADPSLVQAAGVPGAVGDNTVALALGRLADSPIATLGSQTFNDAYGRIVGDFGGALQNANTQLADHEAVKTLLTRQRDAVSGVSVDEEMTDLIRFQKAYEASAKLVATVNEMLETLLNMKR